MLNYLPKILIDKALIIKSTLITILSIQILILSTLLFIKRENRLTNSLLGFVLLFFGLTTINFSLFQSLLQEKLIKYIPYVRLELLYALGPVIYLYTLSVTNPEFKLRKIHYLIFLPGIELCSKIFKALILGSGIAFDKFFPSTFLTPVHFLSQMPFW